MNKTYPAKLLIFGEYTIINNSEALAIPFRRFGGEWSFDETGNAVHQNSNKILAALLSYLSTNNFDNLNLASLKADIKNGIWFNSNIPYGYGLGSSGALTAAVYDKYSTTKVDSLTDLKTWLAKIESFFHGKSSGIDPLVSYINRDIRIESDQTITILPEMSKSEYAGIKICVLDCGFARQSSNLVNTYLEYCEDKTFKKGYVEPMLELTAFSIKSIVKKDNLLKNSVRVISELQFKYMKNMIPEQMQKLWRYGLESDKYSMKLCGAGGGGFLLVFFYDEESIHSIFENYKTYNVLEI